MALNCVTQPLFSGSVPAGRGKAVAIHSQKGIQNYSHLCCLSPSQKCLNICPRVACTLTEYLP